MSITDPRLALLDPLQKRGHLSATNVRMLKSFAARWNVSGFAAILETNLLSEANLADAIADCFGVARIHHVKAQKISNAALCKLPFAQARDLECLPMGFQESSAKFAVVMSDPTRSDHIDALKRELKVELALAVADRSDIVGAVDDLYPLSCRLPSLWDT